MLKIRVISAAACTLLPVRVSPAPAVGAAPQSPSRVVPRAESDHARQTAFEQLLARTIAARRR